MNKNSIDFVIPQFTMRIPFLRRHIELLVRSIHKYVKGIDYSYQELGKDFEMGFVLEKFPGAKTFPQIIVDGKHVGGYDDLSGFLKE